MPKFIFILSLSLLVNTLSAQDYHKGVYKGLKAEDVQLGDQMTPLGSLGAMGTFKVGRADIRVHSIDSGSIASRGGLQKGDIIISANGQAFEKATNEVDDGGKGPREGLGKAMNQSRQKTGILKLKVKRKKKTLTLDIRLDKRKAFSPHYPAYCARSEQTLANACDYLVSIQRPDGMFRSKTVYSAHLTLTATAGLALLASGDKKYEKSIRKSASFLKSCELKKGKDNWTWKYIYVGTFLCEYYLAFGDRAVLPRIKAICLELEKRTNSLGRHAHGSLGGDGDQAGYDNKGLNIITGQVLLTWALARKCGIKTNQKKWDLTKKHLIRCTAKVGGTGYNGPFGNSDGSARTGLFTLALYISGEDPDLQKIQGSYLETNTRRMREAHSSGLFGMIWGTAALACVNPEGYRTHMDYWRWYMEMGETPEGNTLPRWFIPSKRGCGADNALDTDHFNHAAMALMFASSRKNLFVHGNQSIQWFGASKKEFSILKSFKKIHKRPADLLEAMIAKQEQLRQPEQIIEALPYFKQVRTRNDQALKVYQDLHQTFTSYLDQINALSQLRPAYAYHCMNIIKTGTAGDKDLRDRMNELRSTLMKNSKVASLEKMRMDIDKVFSKEEQTMDKLIAGLRSVRSKLESFRKKTGLEDELKLEALFIIRDLNEKIGDK